MIYLDHAATSFHKPQEVAQAVYDAILHTGNSGRGVHGASLDANRTVYQVRGKMANFFNVGDASRVVFTANATDSLNIAIQGLLKPGDHCITTVLEHNSVLRPLHIMEQKGVTVTQLGIDTKGHINLDELKSAVTHHTKAIVMTHASNVLGNIIDIEEIGIICKAYNLLFIVDSSQTAGMLPIDMQKMQIDVLCCSGHKSLLGPQGVGLLCLAEGIFPTPFKAGGTGMDSFSKIMNQPLPSYLEAGTLNTHGIIGLGAACDYIMRYGQERLFQEASHLAQQFLKGIKDLQKVIIYGDVETVWRTPVIAMNIRGIDSADLADELYERFDIAVRAGAHCAPEVHNVFGTQEQGMVRFSFSHMNTAEEVKQAIRAIKILEEEVK